MLLADSGSTNTHWWLAESGQLRASIVSRGLNPFFYTPKSMAAQLLTDLQPFIKDQQIQAVHFYGAGCSTSANRQMVRDALNHLLKGDPDISIGNDLLGAARALFGVEPGIACILGTGSNACLYNGSEITHGLPSLGYVLGDEGSGTHLGKVFLENLLKDQLPWELNQAFSQAYKLDRAQILEEIYRKEHPNRFLASFSVFIHQQMHHPRIMELLEDCFEAFFREQVCKLPGYTAFKMGCVGSVGYHYRNVIRPLAIRHGISGIAFTDSPMEGLLAYHS